MFNGEALRGAFFACRIATEQFYFIYLFPAITVLVSRERRLELTSGRGSLLDHHVPPQGAASVRAGRTPIARSLLHAPLIFFLNAEFVFRFPAFN